MNTRGQYGSRGRPLVGVGALYHSVGDRAEAVKQMALDWSALYQNLASQVGELTPDPRAPGGYHPTTQREWDTNQPDPKKVEWWKSYAKPLFNSWVSFRNEQLGDRTVASDYIAFAERWQTNWDVYTRWKNKLDSLREEAQRRGFVIKTALPAELPSTVVEDAEKIARELSSAARKAAQGAGDTWTFVKYAAWAALGVGTVVALSSVAQNLKAGKDPAERYTQLIRQRSKSAARAMIPAPVRLALPPGNPSLE